MIRLSRVGKKKYPTYRIVIQEKSKDPWGKALEILGNYNPHTKEFACKEDRIKYWLSVGAQMSATVNNLLVRKNIVQGKKAKAAKLKKKKNQAKKDKEAKETKTSEENKSAQENEQAKPVKENEATTQAIEEKTVTKETEEKETSVDKKEEAQEEKPADK